PTRLIRSPTCASPEAAMDVGVSLVSRPASSSHYSRAGHPVWLRCLSLAYSRYARSSRLASRAPRSGTNATNLRDETLARAGSYQREEAHAAQEARVTIRPITRRLVLPIRFLCPVSYQDTIRRDQDFP